MLLIIDVRYSAVSAPLLCVQMILCLVNVSVFPPSVKALFARLSIRALCKLSVRIYVNPGILTY